MVVAALCCVSMIKQFGSAVYTRAHRHNLRGDRFACLFDRRRGVLLAHAGRLPDSTASLDARKIVGTAGFSAFIWKMEMKLKPHDEIWATSTRAANQGLAFYI
eukprot:6193249-Pleurochrysis_carterae.AAC.1